MLLKDGVPVIPANKKSRQIGFYILGIWNEMKGMSKGGMKLEEQKQRRIEWEICNAVSE